MDAQDTLLDDITRKQLIFLWTCWGNGPNAIAKNYDKLETWREEKYEVVPEEPGKMGYIYIYI
jgi:hypothetical protein